MNSAALPSGESHVTNATNVRQVMVSNSDHLCSRNVNGLPLDHRHRAATRHLNEPEIDEMTKVTTRTLNQLSPIVRIDRKGRTIDNPAAATEHLKIAK